MFSKCGKVMAYRECPGFHFSHRLSSARMAVHHKALSQSRPKSKPLALILKSHLNLLHYLMDSPSNTSFDFTESDQLRVVNDQTFTRLADAVTSR